MDIKLSDLRNSVARDFDERTLAMCRSTRWAPNRRSIELEYARVKGLLCEIDIRRSEGVEVL